MHLQICTLVLSMHIVQTNFKDELKTVNQVLDCFVTTLFEWSWAWGLISSLTVMHFISSLSLNSWSLPFVLLIVLLCMLYALQDFINNNYSLPIKRKLLRQSYQDSGRLSLNYTYVIHWAYVTWRHLVWFGKFATLKNIPDIANCSIQNGLWDSFVVLASYTNNYGLIFLIKKK